MKIFIDTGNLDEIQHAVDLGIVDGVTTNPTLASKEGRPFRDLILEMCRLLKNGVVNAEVISTDWQGMLREGRELASWHPNIVVKVPMTADGVRTLHVLHGEGIRVNVTLIFSPAQALIAAKAGAYFVSPFVGRLDDIAENGLGVLREIVEIYRVQAFSTQVLAASLRHPMHVVEAAKMGAHIATMPFKVFEQLFKHPLTDNGLETFRRDWEKARRNLGEIIQPTHKDADNRALKDGIYA